MIEYTINGQKVSEEDIRQMMAEQARQQQEQKRKEQEFRAAFDCSYSVVAQVANNLVGICGLDKQLIANSEYCKKECASYNNRAYEVKDAEPVNENN